jgi:hypothetical protein
MPDLLLVRPEAGEVEAATARVPVARFLAGVVATGRRAPAASGDRALAAMQGAAARLLGRVGVAVRVTR